MTEFNLVFATPFLRSDTQSTDLAARLAATILQRENDEHRNPNSPQRAHPGVFESRFDFLMWPDPAIEEFRQMFFARVGAFVKFTNTMTDEDFNRLRFDQHCWFHVTRDGGFFQTHNHPNASWSAIYCVDPGDDEADDFSAGHVGFDDPRLNAGMHVDPANRNLRRDMSFNAFRIRPNVGELLVFPSYVRHWVEPYRGERPRITIAANFWFQRVAG